MLYKNKNSKCSLGKYAAVALLIGFVSLMVASCEREIMPTTKDSADKNVIGKVNVEGVVVGPDNKPLPGVNVIVKGKQIGATTDANGKFSMVAPGGSKLAVSSPGLHSIDLVISPSYKNTRFDIKLTPGSAKAAETINSTISSVPSADGQSVKVTVQPSMVNGETVFTVVEKSPEFPGGNQEMFMHLGRNIKYPTAAAKANVSGKVFVNFVVTSEGEIKDVTVLKGIGFGADEEAIRVVSTMPRWTPGMQDGKPVNVRYNLPIAFQIEQGGTSAVDKNTENASSGATVAYIAQPKPLIVVDGVEQKADYDVKQVNTEKIEAVNVLKGEKATEKYGAKGANGVVEVTMKKK